MCSGVRFAFWGPFRVSSSQERAENKFTSNVFSFVYTHVSVRIHIPPRSAGAAQQDSWDMTRWKINKYIYIITCLHILTHIHIFKREHLLTQPPFDRAGLVWRLLPQYKRKWTNLNLKEFFSSAPLPPPPFPLRRSLYPAIFNHPRISCNLFCSENFFPVCPPFSSSSYRDCRRNIYMHI